METLSAWWFSWYAAGRAENATTNHRQERRRCWIGQRLAKVGDRGRRPAAGDESVDDRTMAKAADDRSDGRRRSMRHNNQPSMEGFSSSIGGNSNSCRNGRGKGDGGSEGYEDHIRNSTMSLTALLFR